MLNVSFHFVFFFALLRFYTVGQKSSPLKFFAVFSATVWNFTLKFYRFIYKTFYI